MHRTASPSPCLTCAVERRCFPAGGESRPATVAPAGSNRSGSRRVTIRTEALDGKGPPWAVQRACRLQRAVNVEQASKRVMRKPTRRQYGEGCQRPGKRATRAPVGSAGGIDGGMHARGRQQQHGKPCRWRARAKPGAREGQLGPAGWRERPVVAEKPGNAGGAKGPQFGNSAGVEIRSVRTSFSRINSAVGRGSFLGLFECPGGSGQGRVRRADDLLHAPTGPSAQIRCLWRTFLRRNLDRSLRIQGSRIL